MSDKQRLPDRQVEEVAQAVTERVVPAVDSRLIAIAGELKVNTWTSPLPPPEVLAKYEEVLPGFANRCLSKWEQRTEATIQLQHNEQALAQKVLDQEHRRSILGQWLSGGLALASVVAGTVLGLYGHTEAAVAAFVGTGVSAVASAILGRRGKKRDDDAGKGEGDEA